MRTPVRTYAASACALPGRDAQRSRRASPLSQAGPVSQRRLERGVRRRCATDSAALTSATEPTTSFSSTDVSRSATFLKYKPMYLRFGHEDFLFGRSPRIGKIHKPRNDHRGECLASDQSRRVLSSAAGALDSHESVANEGHTSFERYRRSASGRTLHLLECA